MNDLNLKDLMDPKRLELQAKYHHAQIAVDRSYTLAEKNVYIPETKVLNPTWKEGDPTYDQYDRIEATADVRVAEISRVARLLKIEIEKDLNDTLHILDQVNVDAQPAEGGCCGAKTANA